MGTLISAKNKEASLQTIETIVPVLGQKNRDVLRFVQSIQCSTNKYDQAEWLRNDKFWQTDV